MTNSAEQTAEMTGRVMALGGGTGAVVAWGLSWPEFAAIVGAVVAVLGLLVQVWATVRHDKREQELHKRKMSATESPDE